jgi:hypothetical protein
LVCLLLPAAYLRTRPKWSLLKRRTKNAQRSEPPALYAHTPTDDNASTFSAHRTIIGSSELASATPTKARNLPTFHRSLEVDVGYRRRILHHATLDHRHGFSARSNRRQVEAALLQGVMNDFLQWFFVLDHENYRHAFQFPLRAASDQVGSAG